MTTPTPPHKGHGKDKSRLNRRFYKDVEVEPHHQAWQIKLDGRALKTAAKNALIIPSKTHAQAIANEWSTQKTHIEPSTMPCTRLYNVAIDQTPSSRPALIAEARKYAQTDLLCYHATDPQALQERQKNQWGPWVKWAGEQGANFNITQGIIAVPQAEETLDKVADYAAHLDDLGLTLFVHITSIFGSVILGWAVTQKALGIMEALDLSRLDEIWQIEQWGEDELAKERVINLTEELRALGALLEI